MVPDSMRRCLNLAGLTLTLLGAALLFFYGMPKTKVGNVMFVGDMAMKTEPLPGEPDVPDEVWQATFDKFTRRTTLLNRLGFAMVAAGTLLQFLGAW